MSVIQGIGSDEVSTGFYPFQIDQSLMFNSGDQTFLSRTTGTATNTFTFSTWLKRGDISAGDFQYIFASGASGLAIGKASGGVLEDRFYVHDGSANTQADPLIRDPSSWYHVVLSANSGTGVLYINGESVKTGISVASLSTGSGLTRIGRFGDGNFYLDGYLAETHLVTGSALTPTSFGETKNDIWVPKDYSGSYGDDGFKLTYANSSDIGADSSGENHNFTSNSFQPDNVVSDSPTKNFATLGAQPIVNHTLSEGRLKTTNSTTNHGGTTATFNYPTTGKWYHEVTILAETDDKGQGVGIGNQRARSQTQWGNFVNVVAYLSDGTKHQVGGYASYGTAHAVGNIIGVAYNADDQELEFYRATAAGQTASSQGTITTAQMDGLVDFANLTPVAFGRQVTQTFNFGQSTFNGTDGSGSLPTGFSALNTANLANPAIDPADDETPDQYFDTKLYSGNSSTHVITGLQFQPDFVWIKARTEDISHALFDVLRGTSSVNTTNTALGSDRADAEGNTNGVLSSFNSDGFTLDRGNSGNNNLKEVLTNRSGENYVAWTWKAGGSGSSVSAGSISTGPNVPSIASTQSVSTETGFSIVSYQGNGTNDATVQHGLSQKPELSIIKNRSANSTNWDVSFEGITGGTSLNLDTTADVFTPTLGNHERGTQVLTLKDGSSGRTRVNTNGQNYIAYCFHSVDGYSKISIYKGNGSSDGTFVFTGFRPAWLIIKRFDGGAESWNIVDKKRNPFNGAKTLLRADLLNDEDDATNGIDLLSNGFKVRDNIGNYNTNDADYLYMAFADQPFKYSNAR